MPEGLDELMVVAANQLPGENGSAPLPSYFTFDTRSPQQPSRIANLLCYGVLFKVKTSDEHLLSVDLDPGSFAYQVTCAS